MRNALVERKFRSLLEVLRFYAQSFISATNMFSQIAHLLNRGEGLRDTHVPQLGGMLGELMRECEKADLPMTLAQLKRIKEGVDNGEFFEYKTMNQQLQELMNRMWDELDISMFYQVESSKVLYCDPNWLFGTPLHCAFPNAWRELQAGGRCYAYGENTACAFHLNRALEWGLKSLAVHVGKRFDRNTWEAHLKDIEKELASRYGIAGPRTPLEKFYSETAAQFGHMKVAWRNPTMHVEANYDDAEGRYLLTTTEKFMAHLATNNLREQP